MSSLLRILIKNFHNINTKKFYNLWFWLCMSYVFFSFLFSFFRHIVDWVYVLWLVVCDWGGIKGDCTEFKQVVWTVDYTLDLDMNHYFSTLVEKKSNRIYMLKKINKIK